MQEYSITNFKFGLDTRRDVLTCQPGTMVTCQNAFITPGGEVEKRMKFEQAYDLSMVDANADQACFGLEATPDGLTTFTHVASFNGVASTNNQTTYCATLSSLTTSPTSLPGGITALRIYHPEFVFGSYGFGLAYAIVYDRTKHRITAVTSCVINGKTLASVTFADNKVALYYDGDLVIQSCAGEVYTQSTQAYTNAVLLYQFLHNLTRFTDWSASDTSSDANTPILTDGLSCKVYTPSGTTLSSRLCTSNSSSGKFGLSVYPAGSLNVDSNWTLTITPPAGSNTILFSDVDTSFSIYILGGGTVFTVAVKTNEINNIFAASGVSAAISGADIILSTSYKTELFDSMFPSANLFPAYGAVPVTKRNAPTIKVNAAAPVSMTSGVLGQGSVNYLIFGDTWSVGDTWEFNGTLNGVDFTLGAGNLYPKNFGKLFTFRQRVFLANGTQFNFSAVDDVTGWEEQDTGAGFVAYNSQYGANDSVKSFAAYQGQLAVFGGRTIQMWTVSANPASFALNQVLDNIGTVASNSVASIGELETLFLHDTGIRSLRARETTLNAYVNDIGSAIDSIVQGVLAGLTSTQKETAYAIVDPIASRYWLHLNGTIYVLNYFPSSKIIAWSTILPTYEAFATISGSGTYSAGGTVTLTTVTGTAYKWTKAGSATQLVNGTETITSSGYFVAQGTSVVESGTALGARTSTLQSSIQTSFTPSKFLVSEGRIYVLTTTGIVYIYGGDAGGEYDNSIATVELPWLDMGSPSTMKQAHGVDAAFKGKWIVSASMNPQATNQITVINKGSATSPNMALDSTYDTGHYPFSAQGTHVKLKAVTSATLVSSAKLGMMTLLYEKQNKK